MYQFHYTDGIGCKVSLLRIPWYHAYSGIGTLIKKYDLFSIGQISTMDSVSTVKRKVKLENQRLF
jgi:hypothetical protein